LCADADYIPKVPDAGKVRVDEQGNRVQVMHNGLLVGADGYYGDFVTQIIERMKEHHEPLGCITEPFATRQIARLAAGAAAYSRAQHD
jgi:hypothetical protein